MLFKATEVEHIYSSVNKKPRMHRNCGVSFTKTFDNNFFKLPPEKYAVLFLSFTSKFVVFAKFYDYPYLLLSLFIKKQPKQQYGFYMKK